MARRCTTVPGFGTCCRAAQQGLLGRPFQFTDSKGHARCAQCDVQASTSVNPAKRGRQIFRFRFKANSVCGIGPGGCPALNNQGGQGALSLPAPSGVGALQ